MQHRSQPRTVEVDQHREGKPPCHARPCQRLPQAPLHRQRLPYRLRMPCGLPGSAAPLFMGACETDHCPSPRLARAGCFSSTIYAPCWHHSGKRRSAMLRSAAPGGQAQPGARPSSLRRRISLDAAPSACQARRTARQIVRAGNRKQRTAADSHRLTERAAFKREADPSPSGLSRRSQTPPGTPLNMGPVQNAASPVPDWHIRQADFSGPAPSFSSTSLPARTARYEIPSRMLAFDRSRAAAKPHPLPRDPYGFNRYLPATAYRRGSNLELCK